MKRVLVLLAMLCASACANADVNQAYDTLEEAGIAGIERAYACSVAYECGGSIAQRPDGKFVVGPVRSDFSGDAVEVPHRVPRGSTLVADFHTHPCLSESHATAFFSSPDLGMATSLKISGFMGDLCTGDVHMFTPGSDSPNSEQPPDGRNWLTQGRVVGHIKLTRLPIKQDPDEG